MHTLTQNVPPLVILAPNDKAMLRFPFFGKEKSTHIGEDDNEEPAVTSHAIYYVFFFIFGIVQSNMCSFEISGSAQNGKERNRIEVSDAIDSVMHEISCCHLCGLSYMVLSSINETKKRRGKTANKNLMTVSLVLCVCVNT